MAIDGIEKLLKIPSRCHFKKLIIERIHFGILIMSGSRQTLILASVFRDRKRI
jgi:hypothetical protein